MAASDDEDDYMNMTFDEPAASAKAKSQPETSLQRRQRLKREGEIRGRPKSKEELAAEEEAAREKALSRSLLETAAAKKSKGFAMMAKMGFKAGSALGAGAGATGGSGAGNDARTEPIAVEVKADRGGIGMESERKRKLREAAERIEEEVREGKRVRVDPLEYRDRVRMEREAARVQAQVFAAQRVSERMAEEKESEEAEVLGVDGKADDAGTGDDDDKKENTKKKRASGATSRPLKSINVLWRGLARHREEKERDRRMRYDLEQSLSRLPTYEDDDEDADDRTALGKKQVVYVTAEDLDEEDPELDEFNGLEDAEKLRRLVEYLRREHRYCFWCKYTYPDDELEGCPGVTEEDHD
ncbi:G-patch domain-containing protein [Colletotrichum scovillei]|uniref:G-patch domain-containing protein n=1 Tax=Colletotrichum scovillei TaxID=1209932 RepID=A0A9P7UID7_9PEZI|nr:G-patch domain-containing protein [Colletotrichum scovillei]KAF4782260.1 G-patch domain-containing protein [Colletotrichum scovillei]KAG7050450.1 G-patch domain-containing protein [Colletotrichum scovillei]KAG7069492.1 G-patch domain-containing protein [Colletotrichum scovillei]KAG7073438.1 G-patch domain-containing protein [Colletotrichum scovillei]